MSEYHRPIMVNEVLEGLNVKDGGVYFDGTAGGGGHSFAILASNPTVRLIATDKDGEAIAEATKRLEPFRGRFRIFRTDFKNYAEAFDAAGVEKIDGFLLDLGISSHQMMWRLRFLLLRKRGVGYHIQAIPYGISFPFMESRIRSISSSGMTLWRTSINGMSIPF